MRASHECVCVRAGTQLIQCINYGPATDLLVMDNISQFDKQRRRHHWIFFFCFFYESRRCPAISFFFFLMAVSFNLTVITPPSPSPTITGRKGFLISPQGPSLSSMITVVGMAAGMWPTTHTHANKHLSLSQSMSGGQGRALRFL